MEGKAKVYSFDNISELMAHLNQPKPLHPLIALIDHDANEIELAEAGSQYTLNFYKVSFKKVFSGHVNYGLGYYDFKEGGLAFLAPNQVVTITADKINYEGYSLYVHPDLIEAYPLGNAIHKFGFFSYAVSEALFVSEKEKMILESLFLAIDEELKNNIDQFSNDVLVSQLELLFNHSNRFYNRQFLTRKSAHHKLIHQLDQYLTNYFNANVALQKGLPSVVSIADKLGVSVQYLSDMLRTLTGLNTQQYIQNKMIEKAKTLLSTTHMSVAEVAYQLGFEHPQSFHKIFKRKTNSSPLSFRQSVIHKKNNG